MSYPAGSYGSQVAIAPEEEILYPPPEAQAAPQAAPQATPPPAPDGSYGSQVPMETAPAQPAPAPVISPGLGSGSAYQTQPPPEQAPAQAPPPEQPGEWYSGATDAVGSLAGAVRDAGGAVLQGNVPQAVTTLLEPYTKAQEWAVNRAAERAVSNDRLEPSDLVPGTGDPTNLVDVIPTAALAPSLLGPESGAPGPLNAPFNAIGGAVSQLPGFADIMGAQTFDTWAQQNPQKVTQLQAQGDGALWEGYLADQGAGSAPPPEWSNPLEAGTAANPVERAGQIAGGLAGGGAPLAPLTQSIQSGSITPFLKNQIWNLVTDPTIPAQVGLAILSGGLGAAARGPLAGRPVLRSIAAAGSKTAAEANRVADITQLDPVAAADLTRQTIKGVSNIGGVIQPTAAGRSQLQANQIIETAGNYGQAIQAATTPPPISPSRVTPGALQTPVTPNGRPVSPPDLAQPGAPGASAIPLDTRGRRLATAPGLPAAEVVSPHTGEALVPTPARHPALAQVETELRQTLADRHMQDVAVEVLDHAEILRRFPQAKEFVAGGQDVPGGVYSPHERLIAIAADAAHSGQAPFFLDHESIHALRQSQLFTAKEWQTLSDAAKRVPELQDRVRTLYPGVEQANPEMFAQELVAALYTAVRHNGLQVDAPVRNLIQRLIDFLKGLGTGVNGALPADVLRAIDNGEIGKRARQASQTRAVDAYSRIQGTLYHGSPNRDLGVLSANPPERARQFPGDYETRLGTFLTGDRGTAQHYADRARHGPGRVYEVRAGLDNAYDVSLDDWWGEGMEPLPGTNLYAGQWGESPADAAEFRAELQRMGHDGVAVWDGEPRVQPDGSVAPEDMQHLAQVISFRDVPVTGEAAFSRRAPDPAAQRIRDAVEADGTPLRDRDPAFFDRFRQFIAGKTPEEVVQLLEEPFARPDAPPLNDAVTPITTPEGRTLATWDEQSAYRLEQVIEWARGVYGSKRVTTALNTPVSKGGPPVRDFLAAPSAAIYDKMLRMPMGHLLWYDLSGVAYDEIAGLGITDIEDLIKMTAATSPGETPFTNQKLALAVKSEMMRGRPGWVGMRNTSQVERVAQGVGLGGPKTDSFAREIEQRTQALRDPNTGSLPVIDLWQSRAYGLPDAQVVGGSDPLFAIIARHTIEEADALQATMGPYLNDIGGVPITVEPRMVQAGLWVLGRENEVRGGFTGDPAALEIPSFTRGSDYWSAMRQIERDLATEVPGFTETGPRLTREDLLHPTTANALTNYGIFNYESRPHMTVEFATTNTLPGARAEQILDNLRQLPPDHPAVSKILNGRASTAAEKRAGAPNTIRGIYQINRGFFKGLAESGLLDELAASLMRLPAGSLDLSRINTRAWGTWGDVLSPQIDIPTSGRTSTGVVHFPPEVIERMVMGISQAMRQDMAAANAWSVQDMQPVIHGDRVVHVPVNIDPAVANARIIQLPNVHLEGETGGTIKALPEELARAGQVSQATGWPTQIVGSPLMSQIKLIDPRDPNAPRIGDPELFDALETAGYTGTLDVVYAAHTSVTATPDPEVGYGRLIANPYRGEPGPGRVERNNLVGESGSYPAFPVGGRVGETDWGGEPRQRFRAGVAGIRQRADAATAELDASVRYNEDFLNDTLAREGHSWNPSRAERIATLTDQGGVPQGFPLDETAFARRPRSAPDSLTALGHIAGRQRERMLANTDPNARLGYHGYILDPTTDQLLRHTLDVHWRDGTRARGMEFGDLYEQTAEKLERFIQLTRDPVLRASDPKITKEFDRLETLFVPREPGVTPVDFSTLAGPGNPQLQRMMKDRIAGETIADAVERGLPKTAKGSSAGLVGQLGGALDEYSRVRGTFGLFAVWNIPKYFTQNWVGNGIMTALKTPSAVPAYLDRLANVRRTAKEVSGKAFSSYDARVAKMGLSAIPTVDLVDKAAIGGRRGKMLPEARSPLGKAARVFMSEKATAFAQTGDYAQRQAVAESVIDAGYAVLNRNLPRLTIENVRKAAGSRTPLPYTEKQIRTAVGEFLESKRAITDLNTGSPYQDRLGRIAKFEPIYTAEEFQSAMKTKLLAINNRVDTTVLNDALHRMWSDVELSKRVTVDTVKRQVEDVAFSWVPTNVSQAMSKVVMYPYWTTKAGMSYARYMMSHPAAAAAYGRMMQDMEDRAEALGMPDWMQSFFRLMNTPMGMEVWYSPTDLIATFLTFPDWAMESGSKPWEELSPLGQKLSDIPLMLNPLLSLAAYITGAGGPDYKVPDVLGVNKGTTLASSLLNMANAHGLLPDWMGKDANGDVIPLNPRPVDELMGRVGNALSTALQDVTGQPPVPVPNVGGSQASDITRWIEQNERIANPEMSQEDINARVTRVMLDHESPEYLKAYEQMSTQALTLGGGLDLPLTPDAFDRALEAVLRISSPISITAGPEQKFLDSQAKGMTPSGEVPPRNIPGLGEVGPDGLPTQAAKDAEAVANDAKYGASATLASRAFDEEVTGYWDGRDPDGMGDIAGTYNGIWLSRDEEAGVKQNYGLDEPVTVGGYTYSPEEIQGMDRATRNMLATAYAEEHGTNYDGIQAYYTQRNDYDTQYFADHPLVGSYINDFKNVARDFPGGEEAFIGTLMTQNPAYATYVYDHLKDGNVNPAAALSSDAFLASQGIAPSNYSPLVSPPTTGPGREAPPYVPPQPDVAPMAPLHMRAGPGTEYAAQMTLSPGTPLKAGQTQGAWTEVTADVPGQPITGWVATEYLAPMGQPAGIPEPGGTVSPGSPSPDPLGGLGGAVGSLVDAAGAIVGTMAGAPGFGSKPAQTSVGKPYAAYDVVPANDGMGVQSTRDGSDRTWMENMIGPGHAQVNVEYKGPAPAGVSYAYQIGHGAVDGEHAAYDIGCDDPTGNCVGTPMYAPMGGRVVCSGYGDGTGEAVGSPACTYSANTTLPGQAHTIVIDVGKDKNGNPIQLSFNHMGTSTLKPGQVVKPGDMIGTMGNTDKGPHVHLEGWVGDSATGYQIVDPQLIVGGYYFSGVPALR